MEEDTINDTPIDVSRNHNVRKISFRKRKVYNFNLVLLLTLFFTQIQLIFVIFAKELNNKFIDHEFKFISETIKHRNKRSNLKNSIDNLSSNNKISARVQFTVVDEFGDYLNSNFLDAHQTHFKRKKEDDLQCLRFEDDGTEKRRCTRNLETLDYTERYLRSKYGLSSSSSSRSKRSARSKRPKPKSHNKDDTTQFARAVVEKRQDYLQRFHNHTDPLVFLPNSNIVKKPRHKQVSSPIEDIYGYLTTIYAMDFVEIELIF